MLHCTSISRLKQTTNWCARTPPTLSKIETLQVKFKTPPNLIIQALDQLEKGLAATIHQLRSVHVPLNTYLHRIKQPDSSTLETTFPRTSHPPNSLLTHPLPASLKATLLTPPTLNYSSSLSHQSP
ncbi:hypothetical protein O181_096412 [Austropuccinia psidii MF-1]|uniref:Uncharacterized protein n=1 Tax=Austropuccinia psidii MF-1 TaxID=1389203 RepID=A0A9Q3J777_9BASI|nr:hypothetical protein [Austropuccinia psidii MF-1]